jgi:hypothetical protein
LEFVPNDASKKAIRGIVVASGLGTPKIDGNFGRDRRGDWLLLKLEKCVGEQLGFVSMDGEPTKVGMKLMNAGFPIDRPRQAGLSIDPSCRVYFVTNAGALHDCAFLPGNSGGPLFDIVHEGGRWSLRAIAIGSAGFRDRGVLTFDPSRANVATPIAPILPVLRTYAHPHFRGTSSADDFYGSGLFDRLDGGNGDDTFTLDKWGGDTIEGGKGADRVVVTARSGRDHFIADFNRSEGDLIDFSSIDADNTIPGRQAFKLASNTTHIGEGEVSLTCEKYGNRTLLGLHIKRRGLRSGKPDYEVLLNGCNFSTNGLVGIEPQQIS